MTQLRRIDPFSCGKVIGLIYAAFGLLVGLFASCFSLIGSAAASQSNEGGAFFFLGGGLFAVILFPLLYGLAGAFFGVIGAVLYNFVAKRFGGIEVELS